MDGGRLEGRVALITGGTSGIGEATVRLFVAEGARVVFSGRSADSGAAIEVTLGSAARFIRGDVRNETDIERAVAFTVETFDHIDILFNNAGGPTSGGIESVTAEEFHYAMDILVGSVVFGMKHAVPHMKTQGFGRIINNSSVAALRSGMGGYLYSGAKAAVTQLSRLAAVELAPHGITVNTISPGAIATPIFYGGSNVARKLAPEHDEAKMRKLTGNLAKATPIPRAGQPEDIAMAALYLASDDGGFVNGHDLVVDGGMTAVGLRA